MNKEILLLDQTTGFMYTTDLAQCICSAAIHSTRQSINRRDNIVYISCTTGWRNNANKLLVHSTSVSILQQLLKPHSRELKVVGTRDLFNEIHLYFNITLL